MTRIGGGVLAQIPRLLSDHPRSPLPPVDPNAKPFDDESRGPLDETVWEKACYTFEGDACVSAPQDVVPGGSRPMEVHFQRLDV